MSLTNIRNDPNRLEKEMQIFTEEGRYQLAVPGPGSNTPFQEDPFIRLQKWGANMHTQGINIDSDLKGLTRSLTHDCQTYKNHQVLSRGYQYYSAPSFVEQSRATNPAWMIRMQETNRWNYLPLDPQCHTETPFHANISTRILEKDNYCP